MYIRTWVVASRGVRASFLGSALCLLFVHCTDLKDTPGAIDGSATAEDGGLGDGGVAGAAASGGTGAMSGSAGSAGNAAGSAGRAGAAGKGGGGEAGSTGAGGSDAGGECSGEGQCCADADCPTGGSCTDGICSCPERTHACGSECVDSASPDSCGQSCDPCLTPEGGGAECSAGECVPTCPSGQRPCAGLCIAETMACTGQCPEDSHDCSGVCVPNDSVNGCGTRCTACPVPQYGTAICDATSCDFTCDSAHKKCGSACIALSGCCDSGECQGGSSCVDHRCACAAGQRTCGSGAQLRCVSGNCCGASDCQPSAQCSAASMCDCAAGEVKCGSGNAVTCLPAGSCCSNADCGNGFACVSGTCRSFCEQQTRPADVAATDYQCLDFDRSSSLPWPSTTATSGTVATSTTRASSLPRSLRSSVSGNDNSTGLISWTAVGAEGISGATLSLRILPEAMARPTPPFEGGYIDVLCIDSPGFRQCLSYTNQSTLYPIDGPAIEDYTGYYVRILLSGGAALLYDCPLDRGLTEGSWNTVELGADATGSLRINGQDAGGCVDNASGTGTTFRIGLEVSFAALGWVVYYDNVVVSVRR